MNTRSAAMHPASENTSAWTGEGPAALSPSIVMDALPETAWNLRSPCQVRSATTGGFATPTPQELAHRAVLGDAGRPRSLRRATTGSGGATTRSGRATTGSRRRQAAKREPAERQEHERVRQHVAEYAVRPPRFRRLVNGRAERQKALLRRLVNTLNEQLHDEDEQEDRRDLKEKAEVHPMAVSRPDPCDPGRGRDARRRTHNQVQGIAELHQQKGCLHAFAANHEQREQKHARQCANAGPFGGRPEMSLDFALHPPAGSPHVDRQRRYRNGGDESQRTLEPFLVGGVVQEVTAEGADRDRCRDAPVNSLRQLPPPALAQVRKADGDDEERFQPLA